MSNQTPTHQAVREHYGKYAREGGSCCSPASDGNGISNDLYPLELLSGLPTEVVNFTAGSGDPISLADLRPGETVLDLGSGGGLDCFLAARQVGEGGQVIGVDMTPEMLERARTSAVRMNVQNVEFREGLLEALPVEQGSLDVILSNCVINLSPDKPRVFREMFRALRPGGRVAVSDMVANHALAEDFGKNQEGWCSCQAGALERRKYAEELANAGFVDIHMEPNVEAVVKAVGSGRVRGPQKLTREQVLEDLQQWEKTDRTMIVPHQITARKPA